MRIDLTGFENLSGLNKHPLTDISLLQHSGIKLIFERMFAEYMIKNILLACFIGILFLPPGAFASLEKSGGRFIENKGQVQNIPDGNESILYYSSMDNGRLYFTASGIYIVLRDPLSDKGKHHPDSVKKTLLPSSLNDFPAVSDSTAFTVWQLKFSGCFSGVPVLSGIDRSHPVQVYKSSESYRTYAYKGLVYTDEEGNQMRFSWDQDQKGLKLDIPSAGKETAVLKLIGAIPANHSSGKTTFLNKAGGLIISGGDHLIKKSAEKNNAATALEFKSHSKSGTAAWITFLGGTDTDECRGIAADADGNVVITGYTMSTDFPVTGGALQTIHNSYYDAVISKFDSTGNLLWSTYYGGSENDFGYKVATDTGGNIIATGYTLSIDLYVSSSGVFQSSYAGSYDSYVLKLNPTGAFVWSTFFGGTGGELCIAMAVDSSDEIIIGGYTSSTDMPITAGCFQDTLGGALDAFCAKFDNTGNLIWSTYFGGTNSEDTHVITTDPQNNVIIAGDSYSTDLPVSSGCYQSFNAGSGDAYLAKFDPSGTMLWATYFGGSGFDDAFGLAADENLNIYLGGLTRSVDLPIIGSNAWQNNKAGNDDAWFLIMDENGQPTWSTYYGGNGNERALDLKITGKHLFACGYTYSTDLNVTPGSFQSSLAGNADAFIILLDTSRAFYYGTYLGGSSGDQAYSLAIAPGDKLYAAGNTGSTDFPITLNAFQGQYGAIGDIFIASFYAGNWMPVVISAISVTSDFNGQDISCFGASDGSATVSTSGGISPYTFLWSANTGGQTDSTATGLSAGTYWVTSSDVNGNSSIASIAISQPGELDLDTSSVTHVSVDSPPNGAIEITIAGGTPPYYFNWSNGESTANISGLEAGDYTLSVTDENGCEAILMVTVNQSTATEQLAGNDSDNSGLKIFPNPGTGRFTVENTGDHAKNYLITVTNTLGQVVHSELISGKMNRVQVNLKGIDKGIYFVEVFDNGKKLIKKLIVI